MIQPETFYPNQILFDWTIQTRQRISYVRDQTGLTLQQLSQACLQERFQPAQNPQGLEEAKQNPNVFIPSKFPYKAGDFQWCQFEVPTTLEIPKNDFLSWINDPKFRPRKMNCIQGVIFYLDSCGFQLRVDIKSALIAIKKFEGEVQGALSFLNNLHVLLGFEDQNHEIGPYTLDELDFLMKGKHLPPFTVLSFGNNEGSLHMAVVTEDYQIQSLWKVPGKDIFDPDVESEFGKYPHDQVTGQIRDFFSGLSQEFRAELGCSEVFYASTRFVRSS